MLCVFVCVRESCFSFSISLCVCLCCSLCCVFVCLPRSVHTLFYSHSMKRALIWHFKVIFKHRNMNIESSIRKKTPCYWIFTLSTFYFIYCVCVCLFMFELILFFSRYTLQTVSANIKGFMCNSSHVKLQQRSLLSTLQNWISIHV